MKDIEATCQACNRIFVIRESEQELYSIRKRPLPKFCPICYREHRAKKEEERKQKEELAWQKKKAAERQRYQENLQLLRNKIDIIPIEKLTLNPQDQVLYVIGNGFDLMHGVRSSYYDFGNTLRKHSYLRFCFEMYLDE